MNLRQIPKVELHRHLELSVRHSTIRELAPQFGIHIPDDKTFKDRFLITEPMKDLGAVLGKFFDTQKLWATPAIIEQLTYEAIEDAFNEGIKILELRYAPTFIKMDHDDLDFQTIHDGIVKGMEKAEKDFSIAVGLVCIIQRILPVEEAEAVTEFAIKNKDTFVGLDLADNEEGFDSKPFAPFFKKAKDAGLGITVHSGEANVPKAPRYIKDAVDYLGATRIGHGVQVYKDKKMMDELKAKGIVLELCPTSNWLTQAVATTKDHPFKTIIDYGVATAISSDDPGIFNIDLTHEYEILANEHGLDEEDFNRCNDIAAKASFISLEKKQALWPRPIK